MLNLSTKYCKDTKNNYSEIINDLLIQNLPIGISIIDTDGIIISANINFSSIFNKDLSQLINSSFYSQFSNESQTEFKKELNKIITQKKMNSKIEGKFQLKNKHIISADFYFFKIEIENITLLLNYLIDKNHFTNSKTSVNETENHYQTIFENTNDAILMCNLNYGKTLSNFIEANNEAVKRSKYSKTDLLLQKPLKIIFRNSEQLEVEVIEKLQSIGNYIFNSKFLTKDNSEIISEINSYLFNYRGRPAIVFIVRDLSERVNFESQLLSYGEQLRKLTSRLQTVREEERTNVAREIHDELGQILTVLKIQISLLGKRIINIQPDFEEKISSILKLIDTSVNSIQKICAKLRPQILDELGLFAAIEWQTQEFSERTGITCNLTIPKHELKLSPEIKTTVFRIFQETLTNIVRHSNANWVQIKLVWDAKNLILSIKDNGKGITINQINDSKSLGILGMKERASILGGRFEIKNSMGSGTVVKLVLPLN